jgi:propanol-preferring alcohol dehydrogenase
LNMKACVLHKPAPIAQWPLHVLDVPIPKPGPDEIVIKVRACGVCRTDLHVVEGELPVRKSPIIPGHQIVGEIAEMPTAREAASGLRIGDRVGVAWLHRTCGVCRFCASNRENLCERAEFTGWTRDGGFAEYVVAPAAFVYRLPQSIDDLHIAPLLCAGIIGYRCLRQTEITNWNGANLGIYGFGAAGHIAIQIANARGANVYVCTRDRMKHQKLAEELGATWVGDTLDAPPVKLDASIIFAPAGEIVPAALQSLDKGGKLVLGGIHMSNIPALKYEWLYHERLIRSVANNTRDDGREFFTQAAAVGIKTSVQTFALEDANEALIALKNDAIKGAAVLSTVERRGWRRDEEAEPTVH